MTSSRALGLAALAATLLSLSSIHLECAYGTAVYSGEHHHHAKQ